MYRFQERLRYAPSGWSKPYEFRCNSYDRREINFHSRVSCVLCLSVFESMVTFVPLAPAHSEGDQQCAAAAVDSWLTTAAAGREHVAPESIPWPALRRLLTVSVYGGRVNDDYDKQLLGALVDRLFTASAFDVDFPLAETWHHDNGGTGVHRLPVVTIPDARSREEFLLWVEKLPSSNPPQWLGLPPTAQLLLQRTEGQRLLASLALLQDVQQDELAYSGDSSGSGGSAAVADPALSSAAVVVPKGLEGPLLLIPLLPYCMCRWFPFSSFRCAA